MSVLFHAETPTYGYDRRDRLIVTDDGPDGLGVSVDSFGTVLGVTLTDAEVAELVGVLVHWQGRRAAMLRIREGHGGTTPAAQGH